MNSKWIKRVLVSASLSAMAMAMPALHASDDAAEAKEGHHGHGGKMMEKMKDELGLSDAQVEKIKALHKDEGGEMKAAREKTKKDVDALKALVEKKGADADITAAINALQADRKAMEADREKKQEAMRAILTPLQQGKMVLQMVEHMREGMERMHEDGPEGGDDAKGKDADKGPAKGDDKGKGGDKY